MLWKCAPCPVHCRSTQESVEIAGSGSSSNVEPGDKDETWQNGHWQHMTLSPCSYHRPQLFWPYNKQSKSKIRKSFQKPRGPVGKLLATTCGHPLAAHAASTNSRLFKDFYVLRCSWNMSSTRNGSQSSTDFGFLTEIPHPGYLPGRCLTRAATKNETPTPWVYLCCHVTICTIYMVCHGNLAALAPFCVPFCWSYVLYRLLQSLWTTFLEAMFSWYITFSCSLRGYGPKNRICTKNSAIIPRCTPNIIVTTRMTWNILSSGIPTRKTFICYTASWLRGSETKKNRNQSAVGATGATTVHQIVTRIKNLLTI